VVTSQAQVGPYESVQLHSTDGSALTNWLTSHGYNIPAPTQVIIDAYVTQGFDFLALKLVPGQGVQSMQPVRVTSQGAAPTLPLHMVAVGTGPTTGITIWVVADGRWAPSNFPTFMIADSEIAWDWSTSSSNYETLRLAKEAALGGRGWQIESSLELNQYSIQQQLFTNAEYDPTGGYLSQGASGGAGDGGASTDAGTDGGDAGDAGEAGAQLAAASADLAVFFAGIAQPNARITRMRSDVAQSALTNIHYPALEIGAPLCPVYNDQCEQVGTAPLGPGGVPGSATSGTNGTSSASGGASGGPASAPGAAGGGCSTARPEGSTETTLTLAMILGATVGFRAFRARRPRRGRRATP